MECIVEKWKLTFMKIHLSNILKFISKQNSDIKQTHVDVKLYTIRKYVVIKLLSHKNKNLSRLYQVRYAANWVTLFHVRNRMASAGFDGTHRRIT
jgi:hypothetical protein